MGSAPTSLAEEASFLDAREARLAERECGLALQEAELRGRERQLWQAAHAGKPGAEESLAQWLQERMTLLSLREEVFARRRAQAQRRDTQMSALEAQPAPQGQRRTPKNQRHNETISMPVEESDRMDAGALVPTELQRRSSRTTPAPTLVEPPPRQKDPTQMLPLPDRAPQSLTRSRPGRPATAPFMAALTFAGVRIDRGQLEIDRSSSAVRITLSGPPPAVEGARTLRYRSRDGMEASFDVSLRHVVSRPPSTTILVLDASAWSQDAFADFAQALASLP